MKIEGIIYLLDSNMDVAYFKKYNSKKEREVIIQKMIKHYGLTNKSFTIQIAPK